MDREEYRDRLWEIVFTAGMNQRYHQMRASKWSRLDRWFKVATGILSVIGFMTAFNSSLWPWVGPVSAFVTAILAVSLSVLPFSDWSQLHLDIFRRWSDLLEDAEAAWVCIPEEIEEQHIQRVIELTGKKNRINSIEPNPDEKLLLKCDQLERKCREPAPPTPAEEQQAPVAIAGPR